MKVNKNSIIPFKGFAAINLFGFLFVRKECAVNDRMITHETIHTEQMKELLYIFFYVLYVTEWVVKLFFYGKDAYDNLSFEREAYRHEAEAEYLNKRSRYAFLKYLFK